MRLEGGFQCCTGRARIVSEPSLGGEVAVKRGCPWASYIDSTSMTKTQGGEPGGGVGVQAAFVEERDTPSGCWTSFAVHLGRVESVRTLCIALGMMQSSYWFLSSNDGACLLLKGASYCQAKGARFMWDYCHSGRP